MSDLPLTRLALSDAREQEIREAVRAATGIPFEIAPSRRAELEDADALHAFLSDPAIHGPIYNLPKPLTVESVRSFIAEKREAQARGEGLLFLRLDEHGDVIGYSEFDIWPQWGAGDLGGALRVDQQGKRAGVAGAKRSFTWMFEALKLDLIVATGALDNIRTARMLDGLGLERKGEIVSERPDGSQRRSLVWEVTRDAWISQHARVD
ncbi:MAG: GNAT family N-acetyltransferase [Hyphomonadaceae bacterium]|nr:GNAT family N-acetyltransferase [Hyphomonadaceae bacterium]